MTNAELIDALRNCACIKSDASCANCEYARSTECKWRMIEDAADALEAAEHRIEDLEGALAACRARKDGRMPKEGEWMPSMYTYPDGTTEHDKDEWYGELYECSICHYVMIGEENYCPNCGARMQTVTNCHTLEEGEQHGES